MGNAKFQIPGNANTDAYNESLNYDKNGNITSLSRKGEAVGTVAPDLDVLSYVYDTATKNSNRLLKVTDASPNTNGFLNGANTDDDYTYDANGNMTADKNKGITSIKYNHLNLPTQIIMSNGTISYLYNAVGQKIGKGVTVPSAGGVVDVNYLGGFQYAYGTLDFFPHAEGYVKNTSGVYSYVFNYTDHLGNVRLSYSDTNKNGVIEKTNNEILEESNYYPFGLKHSGYNGTSYQGSYKYKYNGKEYQNELGLNMYSYGFRDYMPDIGRWTHVDPLAAHPKQIGMSPYSAFANNPIRYVDPTGMIWEDPKDAERLNKSVNSKIESIGKDNTKIQAQIDKGGLSEKKLAKLQDKLTDNGSKIDNLNQSLADIKSIGEATETYALSSPSQSDGTHGVVKDSKGVIQIEGSNTGLHLHEIRHVGQSISAGGVKFNSNGQLLNSAKTFEGGIQNEVNAYQIQYSYDGSYPAGASSLKDINGTTLFNIKGENGEPVYKGLIKPKK